jgi:hypothetical protein
MSARFLQHSSMNRALPYPLQLVDDAMIAKS